MLKLELTTEEGKDLMMLAQRYLRDLRLELPDFEVLASLAGTGSREFESALLDREKFITRLLERLRV